mmetsp:Transcript_3756/g.9581  ORF Transcript_3756/g.9581 Transcript_3756/m.9581 type:complete len:608 (+) Transcript_3756:83-1906(+)
MGKKTNHEREPLFAPIETTDDDDVELARDGGPVPRYRDHPQASSPSTPRSSSSDDGGPAVRYRDDPGSIFDWGGDSGGNDAAGGIAGAVESGEAEEAGHDGAYQLDEFDTDANGFAPVSLHDEESDDGDNDEEQNGIDFDGNGPPRTPDEKIRHKANKLLKKRVFDDTTYDDADDRIFVGGGWGRHGSQFSLCPRGCFSCSCCGSKPKVSYGPPNPRGHSTCKLVCWIIVFIAIVVGAGYLGYEAGLPAEDEAENADSVDGDNTNDSGNIINHPHTKGEEWLEWLEHEKEDFHMPKFNMTFHHHNSKLNDEKTKEAFKASTFEPMAQAQLLKLSENIFQSCSERSLKTLNGRDACLSLCHGHYCCFEKDAAYGSCVTEPNSYCFAYAACENVIADFEMNNANTLVEEKPIGQGHNSHDGLLNFQDVKLLSETCSKDNIATLGGIRDCTAFCQHHLCCFNELDSENCAGDHVGECQAYDACKILVEGPEDVNVGGNVSSGNSSNIGSGETEQQQSGASSQVDKSSGSEEGVYDHYDTDVNKDIATAVHAVCGIEDANPGDDSWVTACHALCANYLCCFTNPGGCRSQKGEEVCSAYQGCVVLTATTSP